MQQGARAVRRRASINHRAGDKYGASDAKALSAWLRPRVAPGLLSRNFRIEAARRLVRGDFRELHGEGRTAARRAGADSRRLSHRDAWRLDVDRLDRAARHGLSRSAQDARRQVPAGICFRPSLLDRRPRRQPARSAAHSLYAGSAGPCCPAHCPGPGLSRPPHRDRKCFELCDLC